MFGVFDNKREKELEEQVNSLKAQARQAKEDGDVKKSKDIMSKIIHVQLFRFQNTISLWKTGITNFEDVQYPTNEELIQVYNDAVLDAHLTALMTNRKEATSGADFKIVDDKKEEIEEQTLLLCSEWFKDCMNYALDSIFYGYSLIEFGNRIGKDFEGVSIVPREFVYQQEQIVRTSPTSDGGVSWHKPPFNAWHLGAGRTDDMGLLAKAAPLTIYKKGALGSWADFAELFGAPLRIGRTDVRDEALRDNMFKMLAEMSSSAYGVFDMDDQIEFIQAAKTDAFEVFDKQIERMNSELSKLILGSTMTTDDGSSRSQSEVHEKTTERILKADAVFLEYWVNKRLIPFLNEHHNFGITGRFMFDDTEVVTIQEQFDRDVALMEFYNIPEDYIREKYGTPVEEKEQPEQLQEGNKDNNEDGNQAPENNLGSFGGTIEKKSLTLKNESESYLAIINDYYKLCCNSELPEVPEEVNEGYENLKDDVLTSIFNGETSEFELPIDLHIFTGTGLTLGASEGLTEAQKLGFGQARDENLFRALADNAFKFSAAKTFQQVREMSDFLVDENGNKRSFAEFKKKAGKVFDTYNKNYLRTEYDNAFNGSQMAGIWTDAWKERGDFPFLKYITAGDGRVRQEHKKYDGIILPIDSTFWNSYFPPNGWNCRCTVQKKGDHVEDLVTNEKDIDKFELPENFDNNVGKTKLLFTPEHPYFIVEKQYSKLKADNFNLPTLDQLTPKQKAPIKKEVTKEENVKYEGFTGEWTRGSLKGKRAEMQKEFEKHVKFKIPDELFLGIKESAPISVIPNEKKSGAYYNNSKKGVHLATTSDRWKGKDPNQKMNYYQAKVTAHEIGHGIHYSLKEVTDTGISKEFEEVIEVMKKELKEYAKANGRRGTVGNGASLLENKLSARYDKAFERYKKQSMPAFQQKAYDQIEQITSLADSIQGLTKGAYGWGHSKTYMKYPNFGNMEIFAHLTENYFVGNREFELLLPETYAKGNEYLRKLIENERNNK